MADPVLIGSVVSGEPWLVRSFRFLCNEPLFVELSSVSPRLCYLPKMPQSALITQVRIGTHQIQYAPFSHTLTELGVTLLVDKISRYPNFISI